MRSRGIRGRKATGPLPPLLWLPRTTYRPAQPPDDEEMLQMWRAMEPAAPLSWPIEACFIAAETVFGAYATRYRGRSLAVRALSLGSALATITVRTRIPLERRRAQQLGLTIETAPQPNIDCAQLAPSLVWRGYLMLRRVKPAESAWPRALAQRIVGEINRRREWRRALQRGST